MNAVNYSQLSILLVDDEPFMRKLVGRVLMEVGIKEIEEADDGTKGLELVALARKPFDLIICDLDMPNMDGFGFVKHLRGGKAAPGREATPVLILTGHSAPENIQEAVTLGIHGFLVKPVSKQSLEKNITRAMSASAIDPSKLKG